MTGKAENDHCLSELIRSVVQTTLVSTELNVGQTQSESLSAWSSECMRVSRAGACLARYRFPVPGPAFRALSDIPSELLSDVSVVT